MWVLEQPHSKPTDGFEWTTRDYSSVKFFLGRDNMREVLVIR
jgi:hypothetical protein